MSLTTSEMTPADISAITGNNNGFGGNWESLIILFLLFGLFGGWGGRGYGFGGSGTDGVANNYVLTSDFSQLSRQISDAYNSTERKLDGINNGLCSGFYQEAQLFGNTNMNIANGFFGVNTAIKDCCCQTQQNIKDVSYNIATQSANLGRQISDTGYAINTSIDKGFCQTNFNNSNNTRDIIDSQHSDADRILARLDAMETNRLREQLDNERANRLALQGALDRAQLRTDIVNDVRPCPQPAYITCNPWAYQQNSCCGCNQ